MQTCEYGKIEGACGEVLSDEDEAQGYVICSTHRQFPACVCQGCGGTAVRECGHTSIVQPEPCRAPLCGPCRHRGTGHTNEPAPTRPEPAQTAQHAQALKDDMLTSIRTSLNYAVDNQLDVDTTAGLILDALQLHVLATAMSGLVMAGGD